MNFPEQLQPTDKTEVLLPNGTTVALPTCHPTFTAWKGAPLNFDYGKKPVLDCDGEPCFAELVILRLLLKEGWDGVWIEAYGGTHFLKSMPQNWNLQ